MRMHTRNRCQSALGLLLVLLVLSGCGAPGSTVAPSVAPTSPSVETPSTGEIAGSLRQDTAAIQTLCLEVQQSYERMEAGFSQPVAQTLGSALAEIGLQITTGEGDCDATLQIDLTCEALGAQYIGAPADTCYTGAVCSGEVTLTLEGRDPLTQAIAGRKPVSGGTIGYCPDEPQKAPFDAAWGKAVADGLVPWWGGTTHALLLGHDIQFDQEGVPVMVGMSEAMDQRLADVVTPEDVPALGQALESGQWQVRWAAARALGHIGPEAAGAVPALARALEDGPSLVREQVAETLGKIGPDATEAVPALVAALENEEPNVRVIASIALQRVAGMDWLRPLRRFPGSISHEIQDVALSSDATTLALAYEDGKVVLWDLSSGEELRTIGADLYSGSVEALDFSPDGTLLASGGSRDGVWLWDVTTGQDVRYLGDRGWINSVVFSPNGELVAANGEDGDVILWQAETGQEVITLQGMDWVRSLAFSPDGKLLAASGKGDAVLWDLDSGEKVHTFGQARRASTVAVGASATSFSPDGTVLALVLEWDAGLWDVESGELVQGLEGEYHSIAFSPDGQLLVAGTRHGEIRRWNMADGQELVPLTGHSVWMVSELIFSPDGSILASLDADGTVVLWRVVAGW